MGRVNNEQGSELTLQLGRGGGLLWLSGVGKLNVPENRSGDVGQFGKRVAEEDLPFLR